MARDWLTEVFEPAVRAVPGDLRGKLEPAQVFHEMLDHRWFVSAEQDRDVPMSEAAATYVERVCAPDRTRRPSSASTPRPSLRSPTTRRAESGLRVSPRVGPSPRPGAPGGPSWRPLGPQGALLALRRLVREQPVHGGGVLRREGGPWHRHRARRGGQDPGCAGPTRLGDLRPWHGDRGVPCLQRDATVADLDVLGRAEPRAPGVPGQGAGEQQDDRHGCDAVADRAHHADHELAAGVADQDESADRDHGDPQPGQPERGGWSRQASTGVVVTCP